MASAEQGWPPRLAREARLRLLDELLACDTGRSRKDVVTYKVERAGLLHALGRSDEARQAYLDALMQAPTDFAALNDFGALLTATGFRSAARTVYAEAIKHHPGNPKGHVNLANLLRRDGELAAARAHYEAALRLEPSNPNAHQGLGAVCAALGEPQAADRHRCEGYRNQFITTLPYRGSGAPLPLLLLVSAGGGDIPTDSFLDDRVFLSSVVTADFCDPLTPLPPHQLVFNAIGDADLCAAALKAAAALLRRTSAPVINHPDAVITTGRADNARRLAALAGVATPRMIELPRRTFACSDAASLLANHGVAFPLLLRTPGCHTGQNFLRVEDAAELAAAAERLPGDLLLAIEYLDARGRDGNARKYRVMIIDGVIYPLHLAISRSWKVHYFTADMADNPEHRAEDAAFLSDMAGTLGPEATAALRRIGDALGLDYAGVDFGLAPDGKVLLFEANATMAVYPPGADQRWVYRRDPVGRIFEAVRAMMIGRAATPGLNTARAVAASGRD